MPKSTNPPYAHLVRTSEMPERLAACLAGIPAICDHRVCRREDRCLARGVPCIAKHHERIIAHLQTGMTAEEMAGDDEAHA